MRVSAEGETLQSARKTVRHSLVALSLALSTEGPGGYSEFLMAFLMAFEGCTSGNLDGLLAGQFRGSCRANAKSSLRRRVWSIRHIDTAKPLTRVVDRGLGTLGTRPGIEVTSVLPRHSGISSLLQDVLLKCMHVAATFHPAVVCAVTLSDASIEFQQVNAGGAYREIPTPGWAPSNSISPLGIMFILFI